MNFNPIAHWQKTNLAYDEANWEYAKYTHTVIDRGHALVVGLCERLAREQRGGRPTILDIGCGLTPFYDKLRHITGPYIGVEPSVAQLQSTESVDTKYLIRGSGEKLVVADGCIDIALLIASLDHCLDAKEAVRETFRVLRPGGTALFLLENRGRLSNVVRAALGMEVGHGDEHLYFFDVDDLVSLAEPYGEVSSIKSYGFLLGFDRLGSVVPSRVLSMLSATADNVVGMLFPKRGQHFIVTVRKHGDDSKAGPPVFICGTCQAPIEWKGAFCNSCGSSLRWIDGRILDGLMKQMEEEVSTGDDDGFAPYLKLPTAVNHYPTYHHKTLTGRFAGLLGSTARYVKNPRLFRLRTHGVIPELFERLDCPWFHSLNLETVLDIGAYVGRYTETFHALWPDVKIYSFEPLVDCFQELEQRANRIPQLTALNYGLSDKAGEKTLQRHEFAPSSSLLKMTSIHKEAFPGTAESQPVTIRLERLDEVAEGFQLTLPMLVKIDVQGFEDQVLSGGENTIRKASVIIIETSFVPLYEGQPLFNDIHRQLIELGFLYAGSVAHLRSDTSGETLQEDSLFLRS